MAAIAPPAREVIRTSQTFEWLKCRANVQEIHGITVVKLAEVKHEFDAVAGRENEEFVAFLNAVAVADGNGLMEKPAVRPNEVHGNVRIADLEHVEPRSASTMVRGVRPLST